MFRARILRRPALVSGGLVSGGLLLALGSTIHADSAPDEMRDMPLSALVRSYAVYTMCSIPALVDNSPRLLQLASLPGIRSIAETFVRVTFFDQFVGGDTAHATLPLLHKLRAANKGTLFAYSVEVDEAEATSTATTTKSAQPHPTKRIVDEMIRCIDVAADFEDGLDNTSRSMTGRKTWVAIKMSALLPDAHALINLSTHVLATRPPPTPARPSIPFPGCPHPSDLQVLAPALPPSPSHALTPSDLASLRRLHADLTRICAHARARGVRVIFDAEYSWYQPAIDAFVAGLMRVFNRVEEEEGGGRRQVQPLVYGTYQAYLRRTPAHLAQSLEDAKEGGYALGVKLVRGAYHPYELAAHAPSPSDELQKTSTSISISPDPLPPVWLTKPETDACYDACVRIALGAVRADVAHVEGNEEGDRDRDREPRVGVLFGTHNWKSCEGVLGELVRLGLAREVPAAQDQNKNEEERGRERRGRGVVLLPEAVTERVAVGQLYGMCDDLTDWLVRTTKSRAPFVIKYVPYGALSEVMPYLSRRAIENRSVLGDGMAALERRRAAREIRRRVRAWAGGLGFGFGGEGGGGA